MDQERLILSHVLYNNHLSPLVASKIGIDSSELKIIFAGKELQDTVTIKVPYHHCLSINHSSYSPLSSRNVT